MCTVNVRGSGHRVFPSFQHVSAVRDCVRKNPNGQALTSEMAAELQLDQEASLEKLGG